MKPPHAKPCKAQHTLGSCRPGRHRRLTALTDFKFWACVFIPSASTLVAGGERAGVSWPITAAELEATVWSVTAAAALDCSKRIRSHWTLGLARLAWHNKWNPTSSWLSQVALPNHNHHANKSNLHSASNLFVFARDVWARPSSSLFLAHQLTELAC